MWRDSKAPQPKQTLRLTGMSVRELCTRAAHTFELSRPDAPRVVLRADSAASMQRWLQRLRLAAAAAAVQVPME
jgi:AraC-like DNA-binding protein